MNLEESLSEIIKEEAKKLIKRYHAYHNRLHLEHVRNIKRFGHSYTKAKEGANKSPNAKKRLCK
ncbi:TPA: hypothetical protein ACGQST_000912 [Enterobacter kobei]